MQKTEPEAGDVAGGIRCLHCSFLLGMVTEMNHFVPSVGPFLYPHGCRIQGSGYGLRESRDARRQIFHQQRPWLLTSHMIRALADVWDNAPHRRSALFWTLVAADGIR
jgi:hypothetical protein